MDLSLDRRLDSIGPYGQGHPEPVFALPDVRVSYSKLVKEEHVRFTLEDARGARIGGIAFRAMKSPIGEALLKREGVFHAAVRVKRNEFNGNVAPRSKSSIWLPQLRPRSHRPVRPASNFRQSEGEAMFKQFWNFLLQGYADAAVGVFY